MSYSSFSFFKSLQDAKQFQEVFGRYLISIREKDEWVDDMLNAYNYYDLAGDLISGKHDMMKLLHDFIDAGRFLDTVQLREIATTLFVTDKKELKEFLRLLYNDAEILKNTFSDCKWLASINMKEEINKVYDSVQSQVTISHTLPDGNNIKPIIWTAGIASLVTHFKHLRGESLGKKGKEDVKTFIQANDELLILFIHQSFVNVDGNRFEQDSIRRYLKDEGKAAKRNIAPLPPQ